MKLAVLFSGFKKDENLVKTEQCDVFLRLLFIYYFLTTGTCIFNFILTRHVNIILYFTFYLILNADFAVFVWSVAFRLLFISFCNA